MEYATGGTVRTEDFRFVHAYALAGGHDRADLHGTAGPDRFEGTDLWERLWRPDGGFDVAAMHDAEGSKDHLEAALPGSEPDRSGAVYSDVSAAVQYVYTVLGFEHAESRSSDAEDQAHGTRRFRFSRVPWPRSSALAVSSTGGRLRSRR